MTEPPDSGSGEDDPRLLCFSDLENAYDHPARMGRLAGLIDDRRDEQTLVLGSGDDTALGALGLLSDAGRGAARPFFEAVRPEAETFGNHEFDDGEAFAREWASSVPTRYLCANLDGSWTVPGWQVFEPGGTAVGVVGVAHPDTDRIVGIDIETTVTDPVPAVRDGARACRREGAAHVVVLSHGGSHDERIAGRTDVDVVLGGHTHDRRMDRIEGTLLVRSAGLGSEVIEVELRDETEATFHDVPAAPPAEGEAFDAELADVYRTYRQQLGAAEVVAEVEEPIRRPIGGESRVGNFAADAVRAAADADVGFILAGAVRPGPPLSGRVTVFDVVSLSPFEGDVVELAVDGTVVRRAIETVAAPIDDGGTFRFHLSGARVRVTEGGEIDSVAVAGDPLEPAGTYSVATSAYAVETAIVDSLVADDVIDRCGPGYEALVTHARAGGLDVSVEGRLGLASESDGRR